MKKIEITFNSGEKESHKIFDYEIKENGLLLKTNWSIKFYPFYNFRSFELEAE